MKVEWKISVDFFLKSTVLGKKKKKSFLFSNKPVISVASD